VLGIPVGLTLTDTSKENLLTLSSVTIYPETQLEVPLGMSMMKVTPKEPNETEAQIV